MHSISVATTIMPGYDHVSGLERLRGPVTVIRRCESLAELISVARAGLADAVLVAGDTEQLTLTFIASLADEGWGGRTVAVVALSEVAEERERLTRLGVPVASPEVSPQELVALLTDATAQGPPQPASPAGSGPAARSRGRRSAPDRPAEGGHGRGGVEAATTPSHPVTAGVAGSDGDLGALPDAWPEDRSAELHDGTEDGTEGGADEGPSTRTGPAVDPGAESADSAPVPTEEEVPEPPRVTAVWGPAGSPGRTTVAVNLAVELALSGRRTLLVDLDTYAASAGVHVGLLEESAGIAQACRLADQGGITPAAVERSALRARVAGTTLQVLTGLTRADRWPELRRSAVDDVLAAAAAGWDEVVVDCGFCLEEDEELSFDIPAPQRNAATLAGLGAADRIIAVGTGDPVGLPRLIHGLDELGHHVETGDGTVVEVVVNQVRAEASGVAPRSQITGVVERFGGSWSVAAFLPWDRRSLDRALLGGQVLAEAAPSSALRRAVARLAGHASGEGSAVTARAGVGRRVLRALGRS
ncbi:AAA family ATPase [Microbacterium sp. A93]|uniref:AAA family ATPase n=1 Tax=Microbacterium sp. A93 TaxID=3450716 RepID=UPI003F42E175